MGLSHFRFVLQLLAVSKQEEAGRLAQEKRWEQACAIKDAVALSRTGHASGVHLSKSNALSVAATATATATRAQPASSTVSKKHHAACQRVLHSFFEAQAPFVLRFVLVVCPLCFCWLCKSRRSDSQQHAVFFTRDLALPPLTSLLGFILAYSTHRRLEQQQQEQEQEQEQEQQEQEQEQEQ